MPTCRHGHVGTTCDIAGTTVVYRISHVHASEVLSVWIGDRNGASHLPAAIRPAIVRHFDSVVECRCSTVSDRLLGGGGDALRDTPFERAVERRSRGLADGEVLGLLL